MEFTKTILDALKHWVNGKISNIEKALEGKQPSGDYALKSEIPSLEGIATEEYVDNALAEFVPGEGGASVQSDYEQNDSEAADYIKNRPFYMGDLVETEICDINALLQEYNETWQQTEPVSDTEYLWIAQPLFEITPGLKYGISFDDKFYSGVAFSESLGSPVNCFGDFEGYKNLMVSGDASAFNYLVASSPEGDVAIVAYKGEVPPTECKLYQLEQEIVKIDPKYLPEGGVGYVETSSTVETFDIIQIMNDMGGMWETTTWEAETGESSPTNKTLIAGELTITEPLISIIDGTEYQTTVNGVIFTDTAVNYTSTVGTPFPCIGIGGFDEIMSNDYQNFKYLIELLGPFPGENSYQFRVLLDAETFGLNEAPTELMISGTSVTETIYKIDSKYLPEHIKSDWNENDPEAEGYIENRPFYEDLVAGDVLFEETLEDFRAGELSEPVAFIEGETYFVTFNGEEYKCTAWVDEFINSIFGAEVIGLGSTASEGIENKGGNNEPFYLLYAGEATTFGAEEYGTYTIKIQSATMAVAKKIDKKFLPDDVGGINIKTAAEGDLIKVKEVDDTGKPTDYEAVSALNTLGFIDPKTGWEYVGYIYDGSWITCRKPETIEVVQMPDKTSYMVGEPFDPTGMVIVATYSDGATSEITNYSYPNLIELDFKIFCIDGAQYLNIDLSIFKSFQSIEVTQMPNKTSYFYGETFDPTGMVIIGTYENGDTEEITEYTYSEVTSEDFEIYCVDCDMTVVIKLSVAPEILRDFEVQSEGNDYYITGWRGTLNGQPSTEIIIPDTDEYNIIL